MDVQAAVLTPIFRSDAQLSVLTDLVMQGSERSLSDLAEVVGRPYATVHREVNRLIEHGLLTEKNVGRTRLVRADETNPATQPLRELLAVVAGPTVFLKRELGQIDGIESAFIYGSFAERVAGTAGANPSDVDVMVVGEVDPEAVYDAADRVQEKVGREVNVTVLKADELMVDSGFLESVRAGATIPLVGELPW